jgi:hypothetical protein
LFSQTACRLVSAREAGKFCPLPCRSRDERSQGSLKIRFPFSGCLIASKYPFPFFVRQLLIVLMATKTANSIASAA